MKIWKVIEISLPAETEEKGSYVTHRFCSERKASQLFATWCKRIHVGEVTIDKVMLVHGNQLVGFEEVMYY